ncbi:MAG: FKBP-type peptidyl-prolyl cis-trans isomerase [Longimicrobiales bacterium]
MRFPSRAALLGAAVVFSACQAGGGGTAALDTDDQKASYAIGLDMGRNLQPAESRLDMDALLRGLRDAMAENEPALPQEELNTALQVFSQAIQAEQAAQRDSMATANAEAGEAYLAENAAKEGVTVTESGLQFEVLEPGTGATPTAEDNVRLNYRGTLIDGTEFDSSYTRGEPATFPVGGLIPGFTEGLMMMQVGGSYRMVIPSDLAYGPQGSQGAIGPNATIIFEVELLEVVE